MERGASLPPALPWWSFGDSKQQLQVKSAERAERGRVLPGGWQAQLACLQLLFLPFSFLKPTIAGAGAHSRTAAPFCTKQAS